MKLGIIFYTCCLSYIQSHPQPHTSIFSWPSSHCHPLLFPQVLLSSSHPCIFMCREVELCIVKLLLLLQYTCTEIYGSNVASAMIGDNMHSQLGSIGPSLVGLLLHIQVYCTSDLANQTNWRDDGQFCSSSALLSMNSVSLPCCLLLLTSSSTLIFCSPTDFFLHADWLLGQSQMWHLGYVQIT